MKQRLAEALAIIETQQAMIEAQRQRIAQLEARVEELEARLGRDSSNSSKPPSSDPPWKPPAERRKKGRKRGGQPGHKGNYRELVEPDERIALRPAHCVGCGETLAGEDASPWQHQVTEIPELVARVTEYELHTLACACGVRTTASLPEGVPKGAFGPRLMAMVAVCSGAYRLSKRSIEEMLGDFFGVRISLGSVSNLEALASKALAAPFEEAVSKVRKASVICADETHWRCAAKSAWMWIAVTASAVIFFIRPHRDAAAAREIVGERFHGVLVTDQYKGYHWFLGQRRQLCWAHLIRHFHALCDYADAKALGERLLGLTERIFDAWHRSRRRAISWPEFVAEMKPLQDEFGRALRDGRDSSSKRAQTLTKGLLAQELSLWTFVRRTGVPPTNNAAERALRPAVLWRRTSFGTDSERGARFAERALTVVATLRLQKLNVLEFVAEACRRALTAAPPPLLFASPT